MTDLERLKIENEILRDRLDKIYRILTDADRNDDIYFVVGSSMFYSNPDLIEDAIAREVLYAR